MSSRYPRYPSTLEEAIYEIDRLRGVIEAHDRDIRAVKVGWIIMKWLGTVALAAWGVWHAWK